MRLLFQLSAAVVLATLMLAACNSSQTQGNRATSSSVGSNTAVKFPDASSGHIAPSDGVKRVTTVEVRDAVEKGTAIVVDVRGDSFYKQNHIKGSISIPENQIAARISELPRDKMIVTYCS